MKKTRNKLIITTLGLIVTTLIGAFSCTLTWFAKLNSMNLDIGGSVLSEYFDSGDGTQENPFVITRPKHWENLVWLHNNVSNFYQAIADGSDPEASFSNEKGYYFQVGKLNEEKGDGKLYVYDYTDSGLINPSDNSLCSRTLNLNGLGSLIPIGSSSKPFVGELSSDGITISGFDVLGFEDRNNNLVQDTGEQGFNDVGIFGYIGKQSLISGLYFDDFIVHLANSDVNGAGTNNSLHNTQFHDTDGNGTLDQIYVGYIAGHIHFSSTVTNVYINNCKMDGGSAALSGFSYFGIAENEDGTPKPTPMEEIKATKLAGTGNSFGGSVDFYSVYDRLARIYSASPASSTTQFVSAQTFIENDVNNSKILFSETKSNINSNDGIKYRYYSTESGGVFNFPDDNDEYGSTSTNSIYQCLYGESIQTTKTVTTYTFIDDWYECFFIQSGDKYLNNRYYTTIQAVEKEEEAAGWRFDSSNHLYTMVFDQKYYLNRNNYSLTLSTSANTTWTKSGDDEIYTVVNGTNYYIDYEDNWHLSIFKDRYLISDGNSNYLKTNNTNISNVTNESNATRFIFSNYSGATTTIGYFNTSDNNIYYLGNNNGSISLSTTSTTWNKEGNNYYITVQGIKHYIVFEDNQWVIRPEDGVRISDGNGHYLSGNNTTISNSNTLINGTIWHYSSTTGDTQIFNIINGNKYYLTVTNNALAISTNASTWHRTGESLYYTVGTKDYYLIYQNGWNVIPLEYFTISDSSNRNYLVCNGANSFSNTTNVNNATHFYFSDTSGTAPTGTINCLVNGTIYYLNNSINSSTKVGTLQTSTTSTTTCNWSNDGTSIYQYSSPYTYYLEYSNSSWRIRTFTNGYYITDGTNYMVLTGTTPTNTTNVANATMFLFSNTSGTYPSGNISANVNGTTRYLRDNNGTLTSATSTSTNGYSWTNDGNNLKSNHTTNRYLYYNGSAWALSTSNQFSSYYISYSSTYLGTNGSGINKDETEWLIPGKGTTNTTVYTVINGTDYYLSINSSNNLTVSTTAFAWNNYYNSNANRLRGVSTTRYVRYSSNAWTTNTSGQTLTFEKANTYPLSRSYTTVVESNVVGTACIYGTTVAPTILNNYYSVNNNLNVSASYQQDYSLNIFDGQLQNCEKDVKNNVKSGNPTYFPLRVDKDESGNYPDGYAVSEKNTGYLISGANIENSTTSDSGQKKWGDIRVAGWPVSNISGSYTSNTRRFSKIYTVDGTNSNTIRELTTAEQQDAGYVEALSQFGTALSQSNNKVYGVHFMDAAISKEHTIRANQATILGKTYYDYELPEDSIDFNVYQKGKISFFAGEYFTNNNAFFSLHRIFRNDKNDIEEIKEIIEIYKHSQKQDKVNYIYKFADGTYTNANGTYTGSTVKDSMYSSTPAFKTSWIKSPSGLSTSSKRLFYFSIPCNAGEYALGSVSGKNGAYLNYLDIATNGGDTKLEEMKTTETVTTFNVDYRSANEITDHSILQLGGEIPVASNPEDFSITVSFDNSDETCLGTEYSSGIYTIYVVNKTDEEFELCVLVIDDNEDLYDDFYYAYRVIYTNNDNTEEIITCTPLNEPDGEEKTYWQRLAIFEIPPDGEAHESDYTE